MPDRLNGHHPLADADEIDRLGDFWNARVRGRRASAPPPTLVAAIDRLDRLGAAPRPRPVFVKQLKEELMSPTSARWPVHMVEEERHVAKPPSPSLDRRVRRQMTGSAFLSAVLALITLGGAIAALVAGGSTGDQSQTSTFGGAILAAPSPESPSNIHLPSVENIGYSVVFRGQSPAAMPAEAHASLFEATIESDRMEAVGDPRDDQPPGLIVDLVVDGVYRARFSDDVQVDRAFRFNVGLHEYVAANQSIELGRGDAVAYDAGQRREIVNPLQQTTLEFVRVVITPRGQVATTIAAGEGATIRFLAEGDMPLITSQGMHFMLDLVHIVEGALPPISGDGWTVVIERAAAAREDFYWRLIVIVL